MDSEARTRVARQSGNSARRRAGNHRVRRKAQSNESARERLLDAAERLFADYGYNGVSVRDIVKAASVNLGSIPYYFGTKENLLKAVLVRRIRPIQEERRERLSAFMESGNELNTGEILRAILEPALRQSRENDVFKRLAGRSATDPDPAVRRVMNEINDARKILTPKALRMALPHLDEREFYWRLMCVYGVMNYVQADTGRIQEIAGKQFDTSRADTALKYVVPFLTAGLESPAVDQTPRKRNGRTNQKARLLK